MNNPWTPDQTADDAVRHALMHVSHAAEIIRTNVAGPQKADNAQNLVDSLRNLHQALVWAVTPEQFDPDCAIRNAIRNFLYE